MKKLSILIFFLIFASQSAFAQRLSTISAVATDDKTAEKIIGAILILTSATDSTVVKHGMSDFEGKIVIPSVPYGDYKLKLRLMGYEDYTQNLTVNAKTMNLGTLFMKENAIELGEITVKTQAIRTSQNGDTLTYNAAAFKVTEDADAEELLKKLPGVTVNNDGTVTAQGETVGKIFVDGKEFFGEDVTATMKNIPAKVIKEVEVFKKKSDYAQNTGINDGDDFMAMNFVTSMKFGQMGKFSAGYNFKDRYDLNGSYNIFGGPHRLTLNASSNNTGAVNFGGNGGFGNSIVIRNGRGISSGGGFGGDYKSTIHSLGMNYNYEKTDKIKANLNYRFGYSESESKNNSETEYLTDSLPYNRRNVVSNSYRNNNQHTVGGRLQLKITENQNISFRPNLSFRTSESNTFRHDVSYKTTDGLEELFEDLVRFQTQKTDQYNLNGAVQYYLRFKPGRSVTAELSGDMTKNNGDSFQRDTTRYLPPKPDSLVQSKTIINNKNHTIGARMTYTEPLSEFWRMVFSYNFSEMSSDRNSSAYTLNFDTGEYEPWGAKSNIMNTIDRIHTMGPGINYSKNRDMISVNLKYQYSILESQRTLPTVYDARATFKKLIYNIIFWKSFNQENSLDFRSNSRTGNPSIEQLQNVDNINNAPHYSTGNPNLKPYDSYDSYLRYTGTKQTRGTTFIANIHLNITKNPIVDSTLIVTSSMLNPDSVWVSPNGTPLKKGDRYSKPVNVGTGWSSSASVNYGRPLLFIKSNLNVSAIYVYSENDSYFNGESNRTYNHSISSGVSLGTNISEKFSANLGYNFNYSLSQFSLPNRKDNSSINHYISFNLRWITWKNFVVATDLTYRNSSSGIYSYKFENTMCNVTLGKKVFKNRMGEISFTVHDLFNQNKQFDRIETPYSITNSTNNLIKRYFTINFTYTLRNINSSNPGGGRGSRGVEDVMRETGGRMIPGGEVPMRMGGGTFK